MTTRYRKMSVPIRSNTRTGPLWSIVSRTMTSEIAVTKLYLQGLMDILVSILSSGYLRTRTRLLREKRPQKSRQRLSGTAALPWPAHCLFIDLLMSRFRQFKKFHPTDPTAYYPTVMHEEVMTDNKAVLDWLEKIVGSLQLLLMLQAYFGNTNTFPKYELGFCFVKGVPADPEATKKLIERIAFVRHTHYGI